jgi:hypothetical protein
MDVERELRPFRNLIYAVALFTTCAVAILIAPANESPYMHTFFDAGIVVVSSVVAMLLWDMGWRADDNLTRLSPWHRHMRLFELIVLPALEVSEMPSTQRDLPGCATGHVASRSAFAADRVVRGIRVAQSTRVRATRAGNRSADRVVLLLIFDPIPPYGADLFGVTAFAGAGALPVVVRGVFYWRLRGRTPGTGDRIARGARRCQQRRHVVLGIACRSCCDAGACRQICERPLFPFHGHAEGLDRHCAQDAGGARPHPR